MSDILKCPCKETFYDADCFIEHYKTCKWMINVNQLQSTIKELEEKQRDLVYHLNHKTFGASLDCSPTEAWRIGRSQVIEAVEKYLTQLDE